MPLNENQLAAPSTIKVGVGSRRLFAALGVVFKCTLRNALFIPRHLTPLSFLLSRFHHGNKPPGFVCLLPAAIAATLVSQPPSVLMEWLWRQQSSGTGNLAKVDSMSGAVGQQLVHPKT
jgi:hypothetical protein